MLRDVLSWLCVKQETVAIDCYPTTSLCSLASLPGELYHHVLVRIFLFAAPSDHLSLLLVCKKWNEIGRSAPLTLRPNKFLPLALRHNFPKVGSLDLSAACEVQDERLPCLVGLENLVALRLKRCREITDVGVAHLHPLTQLQSLNLGRCYLISDAGLSLLCKNLVHLKRLNIKHCYALTSNGLAELTSLRSLVIFNCSGCQGLRYEALNVIGHISSLKVLKMKYCTAAVSHGIEPLLKLTVLNSLLLKTDDQHPPNSDILLQGVAHCLTRLQRLDLTFDESVSSVGFDALMSMTKLEFLYVGGRNLMEKQIFDVLAQLQKLRKIQLVDEGTGRASLSSLSTLKNLHSLGIKRTDNAEICVDASLPGLSKLTGLTDLVLWNTLSLTGDAIANLTALQELHLKGCPLLESTNMDGFTQLRCLRILKFGKCDRLDDAIVNHLKWIPHLEQLYISACPLFTGKYFGVLSQLVELSTIVLQFSAGITDTALKQLNAIVSLHRLEVVMCPLITEDGLRVLLSGDLKNLEYLNISGCLEPRLTTQTFQNKLPKFKKLDRGSVNLSMLK